MAAGTGEVNRGFYTVGEIAAFGAAAGETHIEIACNRCERPGRLSPGPTGGRARPGKAGARIAARAVGGLPDADEHSGERHMRIHDPQMPRWVGVAVPDGPA
jgi:hypothetical protein